MKQQSICLLPTTQVLSTLLIVNFLFGSVNAQPTISSGGHKGGTGSLAQIPYAPVPSVTSNYTRIDEGKPYRSSSPPSTAVTPKFTNSVIGIKNRDSILAPMYPRYPMDDGDVLGKNKLVPKPPVPKEEFDRCTAAVRNYAVSMHDATFREAYAKACLDDKLPPEFAEIDLAAAGVRVIGTSQPFCSGVIIRPGVFLTAKHCFFNAGNGAKRYEWEQLEQGKIELVSGLAKPHRLACAMNNQDKKAPGVALCSEHISTLGFDIDADKIILNIPTLGNEFQGMKLGSLAADSELLLYAFFEGLENRHFSRISCKLISVKGKCATHLCQASGSSSGSPLVFKNSQNELLVGGIHIGKAEQSASCGLEGGEQINVGVLISD